jgi:hypothetical protein
MDQAASVQNGRVDTMKVITTSLTAVLVLFMGLNAHAGASPSFAGDSENDPGLSQDAASQRPNLEFVIGVQGTLANSYNRGTLDTWFGEITGDPDREVDQGSPAFFALEAAMLFPVKKEAIAGGISMSVAIPASHALWGTQLYYGGRQELVLDPMIFSVGMPIRFQLGSSQRFFATVTPAMLMGWVTGTYTSSTTGLTFTASPSFGFGMSAEGEVMFSRLFGATCRFGFRRLKADLAFEDDSSSTGYSTPLLSTGEEVQADLGGTYFTMGIALHL